MTNRMFRVLETIQRLDRLLVLARGRKLPDPLEIARLEWKRRTAKKVFRERVARS